MSQIGAVSTVGWRDGTVIENATFHRKGFTCADAHQHDVDKPLGNVPTNELAVFL